MKKLLKQIKNKIRYWLINLSTPSNEKISFDTFSLYRAHGSITYRGVLYSKCPFDYVLYQMILREVDPDLVIEIGTNIGGGALYLADLMDISGHGMVHTIDVEKKSDALAANHPRIKLFTDGWENYDLNEAKKYSKILVIDDGSHFAESTLGAMKKFAPLVSVNSYLIVEDGIINALQLSKLFNGGPIKAINDFLPTNQDFIIDRKWCDFFGKNATFNVNGYLKRVK